MVIFQQFEIFAIKIAEIQRKYVYCFHNFKNENTHRYIISEVSLKMFNCFIYDDRFKSNNVSRIMFVCFFAKHALN